MPSQKPLVDQQQTVQTNHESSIDGMKYAPCRRTRNPGIEYDVTMIQWDQFGTGTKWEAHIVFTSSSPMQWELRNNIANARTIPARRSCHDQECKHCDSSITVWRLDSALKYQGSRIQYTDPPEGMWHAVLGTINIIRIFSKYSLCCASSVLEIAHRQAIDFICAIYSMKAGIPFVLLHTQTAFGAGLSFAPLGMQHMVFTSTLKLMPKNMSQSALPLTVGKVHSKCGWMWI